MAAWAIALELGAMAELDRRRMAEARARGGSQQVAAEFVIDELAAALHLTDSATAIRAAVAWKLAGPLSATGQALAEGRIDFEKARTICDAVTGLTHTDMTAVQDQVLDSAERCTVGQLRPLLRKAVAAIAPEQDEQRTRQAEDSRRIELWPTPEGTVDLCGRDLPEADAHAAFNRLTALARCRQNDGDTRPLDLVRADVFLELLRGRLPADTLPPPQPTKQTNRGTSKSTNPPGCRCKATEDPVADVAAHIAERARGGLAAALANTPAGKRALLAAEAGERIRRALNELASPWCTTGASAGHGHDDYRPPAALRRHILQRDRRCMAPSCRRPAEQSDVDHTIPFHRGGPTCGCNLSVLCRFHHRAKQQPGWRVIQIWPGILLWITPNGHWRLTGPAHTR
jgi:Domain of unknown function (DUF222)